MNAKDYFYLINDYFIVKVLQSLELLVSQPIVVSRIMSPDVELLTNKNPFFGAFLL